MKRQTSSMTDALFCEASSPNPQLFSLLWSKTEKEPILKYLLYLNGLILDCFICLFRESSSVFVLLYLKKKKTLFNIRL